MTTTKNNTSSHVMSLLAIKMPHLTFNENSNLILEIGFALSEYLTFIDELEQLIDIIFTLDEISGFETPQDIINNINNKI